MKDPLLVAPLPCSRADSLARKFCEHSNAENSLPALIVCWPSSRVNKYQSLLYRNAAKFGYAVEGIGKLDDLKEIYWPGPVIFHAHWFGQLSKSADSEVVFRQNIDDAFELILEFQQRTACKMVWTAHNLLPHNSAFPETDIELRRRIIERFDLVHFMDKSHPALLENLIGERPTHTLFAPHPHYGPAHADQISREEARDALGFDPSSTILLFFGSIRPYKRLEDLIAAFRKARAESHPELRLAIAGFPSDAAYVDEILTLISEDPAIRFVSQKIADEKVQLYFRAADTVVLPYAGNQLNSGAAMLALTFGCPVIAPDEPAFSALTDYGVSTYDRNEVHSLSAALVGVSPSLQTANKGFKNKFDPDAVSDLFLAGIDQLISSTAN
ncbi:glycosyltransferase involved in cell wall biosynthesis [Parasphingopyxis lamellibrachiae]|uniref:Glycosyltransferase involved in cell wall biosynthesis n=2 Tax=Parasphingopyxis lamellibrachiae TaxID=680125 RepID=A0A3D9FGG0_9SPHN|nr:glycosyltransferase involved in cell wall biosynthesis [Parasphingopyxis lamellibrachiae]